MRISKPKYISLLKAKKNINLKSPSKLLKHNHCLTWMLDTTGQDQAHWKKIKNKETKGNLKLKLSAKDQMVI